MSLSGRGQQFTQTMVTARESQCERTRSSLLWDSTLFLICMIVDCLDYTIYKKAQEEHTSIQNSEDTSEARTGECLDDARFTLF